MNHSYYIVILLSLTQYNVLRSMQDMAIMLGAQQGAMVAQQEVSKEFKDIFSSIQANQQTIQNAISLFSNDMQNAQQAQMNKSIEIFTQASQHISDSQSDQTKYSKEMQTYLFQAISIQRPQQHYLLDTAIKLDQLFTLGTMYTPQGVIWKNPFGVGNWEYDHTTDSFWQLHNESFENVATKSSENAIQNSIFTEYFNQQNSYSIQCEVTLHHVKYPFFAGIMFNKMRWISGDQNSITKCRMLGIYGSNKEKTESCFAEQYTITPTTTSKSKDKNKNKPQSKTVYPLEQVHTNKALKKTPIDKKQMANLQTNPTTFIFKIITSPQEIQFKVWPKQAQEPSDYTTIKSKDSKLYLYHNIGFVSPGAIAQFKLIQPEALLFSQNAIKAYAQDVQKLLTT